MGNISILSVVVLSLIMTGCTKSSNVMGESKEKRIIYMSAVEPKGGTTIDKEPFPGNSVAELKGYILKSPDSTGRWETSTYRWDSGTIVVNEGEEVELHIWGINGDKHHSIIEGYNKSFIVERGKLTKVNFKADKPGIFNLVCHDHLPSMQTQLLVLSKK